MKHKDYHCDRCGVYNEWAEWEDTKHILCEECYDPKIDGPTEWE